VSRAEHSPCSLLLPTSLTAGLTPGRITVTESLEYGNGEQGKSIMTRFGSTFRKILILTNAVRQGLASPGRQDAAIFLLGLFQVSRLYCRESSESGGPSVVAIDSGKSPAGLASTTKQQSAVWVQGASLVSAKIIKAPSNLKP
jgi:hypothetical protein